MIIKNADVYTKDNVFVKGDVGDASARKKAYAAAAVQAHISRDKGQNP